MTDATQQDALWSVDVFGQTVIVCGKVGRDHLRVIDAMIQTLIKQLAKATVDRILDQ